MINRQEENGRLGYLDSIRGIAALLVVLCHCWRMTSDHFQNQTHDWSAATNSIFNFFFYILSNLPDIGRSAVMVFYVLSGFVLAHSLLSRPIPYAGFAIKRFFRIYPAFAFAVLGSYALHSYIGIRHSVTSIWLAYEMSPNLKPEILLKNLALWSTTGSNGLDRVMWSLVHEMRISLIFPLILLTLKRFRGKILIAYAALSIGCTLALINITGQAALGYEETTFALTFLDTGYYIIFFAIGGWLALERKWVAEKIAKLPAALIILLAILITYLFVKDDYDIHTYAGCINDYLRGIGAVDLIALALGFRRFEIALSHRLLIWLGRISYSLYLVHCPVLYAVNQTIGESWSIPETTAVVLVISLTLAEIMARLIEFPFIKLGKKLAARTVS